MNVKISKFFIEKINDAFNLPKYDGLVIEGTSVFEELPWTPARLEKFKKSVEDEFEIPIDFTGTINSIIEKIDSSYTKNFFRNGGRWYPRTETFEFTGWNIVDKVNALNPKAVLDVGCGYNPFKGKIQNLTGIDKYNTAADFMVDIMEYDVNPETYDAALVFGSLNFVSLDLIKDQMKKVVSLVKSGGMLFIRANSGQTHPNGKYMNLHFWTFKDALTIAEYTDCEMITLKKDAHDRIYIEMRKR